MKKVFFLALGVIFLASCGQPAATENAETVDTTAVVADTAAPVVEAPTTDSVTVEADSTK